MTIRRVLSAGAIHASEIDASAKVCAITSAIEAEPAPHRADIEKKISRYGTRCAV